MSVTLLSVLDAYKFVIFINIKSKFKFSLNITILKSIHQNSIFKFNHKDLF